MNTKYTLSLLFFTCTFLFLSLIACGLSQSTVCNKYVDCQHYYDELHDKTATELNKYDSQGVCWENDSLAKDCNKTCDAKLKKLIETIKNSTDPLTDACTL